MATRRGFLAGLLATGAFPTLSWADAGSPDFLSAARRPNGEFALVGLTSDGAQLFHIPLPGRGHAAAAHPKRPEAVAFARRPGVFAVVINCATGKQIARLSAPEGWHFYGHGTFSPDGALLFTTENDFDAAQGMIGVWDAENGYARLAEFSSGGVGPHDICLMPDGQTLAVANGGIETHPDTGRSKLNLPTMHSNLSYIGLDGELIDQIELGAEWQRNSIRHLAVAANGQVAFGLQWQGESTANPPLVGLHQRGKALRMLTPDRDKRGRFLGYVGSIAFADDGDTVAITSPHGGHIGLFDVQSAALRFCIPSADVGGVASSSPGFVATNGTGAFEIFVGARLARRVTAELEWDNHLVKVARGTR